MLLKAVLLDELSQYNRIKSYCKFSSDTEIFKDPKKMYVVVGIIIVCTGIALNLSL